MTCSAARPTGPTRVATTPVAAPPAPIVAASAPELESAAPPVELPPQAGATLDTLAPFYDALNDLAAGRRAGHVRVAWFGDSHTAADLWTGAVRRVLQERYGDGGPGFVHVGWAGDYRHEGVRVGLWAKWSLEPKFYASSKTFDDGVFGLGGVRAVPSDPECRAFVDVTDPNVRGASLTWDLAYRLSEPGASIEVTAPGGARASARAEPGSSVRHVVVSSPGTTGSFEVRGARRAQYFGVVVESDRPGIVLDTLGLNGARMATALSWDAASWQGELSRRRPDLVVFAYGTNESQEQNTPPARYADQIGALIERARASAPEAGCLIVTPIDRVSLAARPRLAALSSAVTTAAASHHCAVWSALSAMGGPGSMATWQQEKPPRAAGDGIHLNARGYAYLGERLAHDLLDAAARRAMVSSGPGRLPGTLPAR